MKKFSGISIREFICTCALMSAISLPRFARADGLPGDYLITQRWRDLFSSYSSLTNPAFLTEENFVALRFAVSPPPLNNSFSISELGATIPIGLDQSFGISWISQGEPKYQAYTKDLVPDGDQLVGFSSNAFQVTYAINAFNRLSLGANLTLVHQDLFQKESRLSIPPGVDVGVSYRVTNHPFLGQHLAGISLQNLIPPTLEGKSGTEEIFSRNLKVSWLSYVWEKKIEAGIDVDVRDFLNEARDFITESSSIEYEMSGRIGAWIMRLFKVHGQFGIGENNLFYWGVGAGVNAPMLNLGRDFSFVYQYNMMHQDGIAGSHTMYARVELGKHREELFARKMAKLLDTSPNDLYNRALSLYYAGKYWDAFWVFGQILSQFPDFFKNDWVKYYFHSCQEILDMRTNSFAGYRQMVIEYPTSDAVNLAHLGAMRIAYREGAFSTVEQQYERLTQPSVPDSLKYHAVYLMAQSFSRQGSFAQAEQLFGTIPEGHPQYPFAQHSLAIAHFMQNETESAMAALENVAQFAPRNASEKEIVHRSFLFMGYLFYEEGALSKAVSALRRVPNSSYYAEDALLGLGWSAVKARQWNDCFQAGDQITKISRKPVIICEGYLLKAYAALMDKRYAESASILREAKKIADQLLATAEDTLNTRRASYRQTRTSYDSLAGDAEDLAQNRYSPEVVSKIDSLRAPQIALKARIDSFLVYQDEFQRMSFFSRTIDKIKMDIEYALVTAEKMAGSAKQLKSEEKDLQKLQNLEQEMEKVKKQIQKIGGDELSQ